MLVIPICFNELYINVQTDECKYLISDAVELLQNVSKLVWAATFKAQEVHFRAIYGNVSIETNKLVISFSFFFSISYHIDILVVKPIFKARIKFLFVSFMIDLIIKLVIVLSMKRLLTSGCKFDSCVFLSVRIHFKQNLKR